MEGHRSRKGEALHVSAFFVGFASCSLNKAPMFLFCSGPPELCSQPVLSGQEASPAVSELTARRRWPSISVGSWPGHPALRATWGQLPSGQGAGDGTLNLSFLAQKPAGRTPHPESQVRASRGGPGPLQPFTRPPPRPHSEQSSCAVNPGLPTPERKATWFQSLGCCRLSASSSVTPVLREALPRNP